ncbi:hypothetical protein BHE74_00029018 [Ensete ventricosum]|nr:hypothetical protein BHE74_00029018 [Ensete ventricosum]
MAYLQRCGSWLASAAKYELMKGLKYVQTKTFQNGKQEEEDYSSLIPNFGTCRTWIRCWKKSLDSNERPGCLRQLLAMGTTWIIRVQS